MTMQLQYDNANAATLPFLVRALAISGGDMPAAALIAEGMAAPTPAVAILKAAIGSGTLNDPTWAGRLAELRGVTNSYLGQLGGRSGFVSLLDSGVLTRLPLRQPVVSSIVGAVASSGQEGHARPVSKMTLAAQSVDRQSADAIIVLSRQLLEDMSASAQSYLSRQLRRALAKVIDTGFFDSIISSGTPQFASSGNTDADRRADLLAMLDAVNSGEGRLAWMASKDVANALAVSDDSTVSPEGISSLANIPFAVSPALTSGTLMLIDGDRVGGDVESVGLDLARHASIEMSDTPAGNVTTPTPANMVSMFQTNSVAVKLSAYYGAAVGDAEAVAMLTDIAWGQAEGS
jgi:hypothetical protein